MVARLDGRGEDASCVRAKESVARSVDLRGVYLHSVLDMAVAGRGARPAEKGIYYKSICQQ